MAGGLGKEGGLHSLVPDKGVQLLSPKWLMCPINLLKLFPLPRANKKMPKQANRTVPPHPHWSNLPFNSWGWGCCLKRMVPFAACRWAEKPPQPAPHRPSGASHHARGGGRGSLASGQKSRSSSVTSPLRQAGRQEAHLFKMFHAT